MPTRIAVLGGRGWLGEAITRAAQERGLDTVVVTRGTPDASGTPGTAGNPGALAVDVTDPGALARALDGCDAVVNAAGRTTAATGTTTATGTGTGAETGIGTRCGAGAGTSTGAGPAGRQATGAFEGFEEANVVLPDRLGSLAARHGWRLVHLGSAAEYGPAAGGRLAVAEGAPGRPASPYGRSKLAGTEALLRRREQGADVVVARVFNVAGPGMPAANPVHGFVGQVLALGRSDARAEPAGGRPVVGVGDPTTVRDVSPLAWVADAVVALALAERRPDPIVNVCSGVPTSFGSLVEALGRHVGLDVDVHDLGWPRGGQVVGNPRRLRDLVRLPIPTIDDVAAAALGPAVGRRATAGVPR